MRTDSQPAAGPPAGPIEALRPSTKRRVDRIDELARPLGEKRAALQVRRQRAAQLAALAAAKTTGTHPGEFVLASKDGTVAFALRATTVGLLIERTQQQPGGARLVQTMVFSDLVTFDRWCAAEPIRFDAPVLYDQLRRDGHEALGGKR